MGSIYGSFVLKGEYVHNFPYFDIMFYLQAQAVTSE